MGVDSVLAVKEFVHGVVHEVGPVDRIAAVGIHGCARWRSGGIMARLFLRIGRTSVRYKPERARSKLKKGEIGAREPGMTCLLKRYYVESSHHKKGLRPRLPGWLGAPGVFRIHQKLFHCSKDCDILKSSTNQHKPAFENMEFECTKHCNKLRALF